LHKKLGGLQMNRDTRSTTLMLCAAAGLSLGGIAHADDTAGHGLLRDPLPDSFTLAGVTLYATIDVGYIYQSNGVPLSSKYLGGLEYQAFTTTRNFSGSQSTFAESGLEQSKVGIRVDLPIYYDFNLVGRIETGFNPLSGQLTDACASIADNSGVPQGRQTANADSSRCGQPFNGPAFGGMSNKTFGTLLIGRQQSLQLDALALYDPQSLSYAFSFLGYSGFDGGAGSTEGARWDNSAKYSYTNGPAHAAIAYSNGGADTGVLGHAYGIDVGATLFGASVEGVYQHENGAVNLRSSFDNVPNPLTNGGLAAYASNDTSWNLMGKYLFDFGAGAIGADGKSVPSDKLTAYIGFSHIKKAHSNESSGSAQGDYLIDIGINVNDPAQYTLEWLGAKYAMASGWTFSAAYYHAHQNSWTIGLLSTGTQGIGCVDAGLLCGGSFNEASVSADYTFTKHLDAYAGVNYSNVTDGLASGYAGTPATGTKGSENQSSFMIGYRIRL
jgi:predicted porin